jgi:hypothetical protein
MALDRRDGRARGVIPRPGPQTTTTPASTRQDADALMVSDPWDRRRVVDLAAYRCCIGQCIQRPEHDAYDFWPQWALESRWTA